MIHLIDLPIGLLLIFCCNITQAQQYQFAQPLKIQTGFSGTFGELRSNHFHSGIDLRTQGRTGFEVHASEKGYIARIKVSATGYGRALYINHPNGLTTVYAHLDNFCDTIAQFVKNYQYRTKTFECDLYLKPGQLKVEKDQVIGVSGNTGSSGGPHLHYEVRTTSNQKLLQPINFFPRWKKMDNKPPIIGDLYMYQIDSALYLRDSLYLTKVKLIKHESGYTFADTLYAKGKIGFGVVCRDLINSYSTTCGANGFSLEVNGTPKYSTALDGFSFTESKHINSLIDYGHYTDSNKRIVRFWREPNNPLSTISVFDENNGIVHLKKDSTYNVTINVWDSWGNNTSITGILVGLEYEIQPPLPPIKNSYYVKYNQPLTIDDKNFSIVFSKNSFYHDVIINYSYTVDSNKTPQIEILPTRTPLKQNFTLTIKTSLSRSLKANKMYIGQILNEKPAYCKTKIVNSAFVTNCSYLGTYSIFTDTIPPKVIATNFSPRYKIKSQKYLEFTITDNVGIRKYSGYIDDKWEVFEWDLKTETLRYKLDPKNQNGKWHEVRIEVDDLLNNKSVYRNKFLW